jgi:hypothetical protein
MTPDAFNYRDHVPPMVYTVEAKRVEDLLQTDFSRAAQVRGDELPAYAQAVVDGLAKLVEDLRANPVAKEVLTAAQEGIRGDLQASLGHEADFKKAIRDLRKLRQQALQLRDPALVSQIDTLTVTVKSELSTSRRVSAAYQKAMEELARTSPKVLTPEEQQQIEWIDQRLVLLQEFQERVRNHPEDAEAIAKEYMGEFSNPPLIQVEGNANSAKVLIGSAAERAAMMGLPSEVAPRKTKSARQRLDERSALMLFGALVCAVPSVVVAGAPFALFMGILGMMTGAALYPLVETRL